MGVCTENMENFSGDEEHAVTEHPTEELPVTENPPQVPPVTENPPDVPPVTETPPDVPPEKQKIRRGAGLSGKLLYEKDTFKCAICCDMLVKTPTHSLTPRQHMENEHPEVRFHPCGRDCTFICLDPVELKEHIKEKHNKSVVCKDEECSQTFKTEKSMAHHFRRFHKKSQDTGPKCPFNDGTKSLGGCQVPFGSDDDLLDHLKTSHKKDL